MLWRGDLAFMSTYRTDTFSLGVCNGCQLMALLGWVPGTESQLADPAQPRFIHNTSGRFESRWATVQVQQDSPAIMLKVGHEQCVHLLSPCHIAPWFSINGQLPIKGLICFRMDTQPCGPPLHFCSEKPCSNRCNEVLCLCLTDQLDEGCWMSQGF